MAPTATRVISVTETIFRSCKKAASQQGQNIHQNGSRIRGCRCWTGASDDLFIQCWQQAAHPADGGRRHSCILCVGTAGLVVFQPSGIWNAVLHALKRSDLINTRVVHRSRSSTSSRRHRSREMSRVRESGETLAPVGLLSVRLIPPICREPVKAVPLRSPVRLYRGSLAAQFFDNNPSVNLYVCSPTKGAQRQEARLQAPLRGHSVEAARAGHALAHDQEPSRASGDAGGRRGLGRLMPLRIAFNYAEFAD